MFGLSIRLATLSVAAFVALAVGSTAQASSTFDLRGSGWDGFFGVSKSSFTFGADGVTLTVTASQDSKSGQKSADVHQTLAGLGVSTGLLDNKHVEPGETLWLEFSETVMLTGAAFSYAGYGEEARFVDDQGELLGDIDLWPSFMGFLKVVDLDGESFDLVGTKFGLTAVDDCDDFRLTSLYFTTFDLGTFAAVPVPAAVWPALALMLGLAVVHRFRRQSA